MRLEGEVLQVHRVHVAFETDIHLVHAPILPSLDTDALIIKPAIERRDIHLVPAQPMKGLAQHQV